MKKITFFLLSLLTLAATVHAQLHFPELEHYKRNKRFVIYGSYEPKGDFAKEFPGFLTDGKYYLDNRYPGWTGLGYMALDSKKYPANLISSRNNLAGLPSAIVLFNTNEYFFSYGKGDNCDKNFVQKDILDAGNSYKFKVNGTVQARYDKLNVFYKDESERLFHDAALAHVAVADLAGADYRQLSPSPNTVIFDFVQDEFRTAPNRHYRKLFPSYMAYTLNVKNAFGEVYKTYHQVIFAETRAKTHEGKYPSLLINFLEQSYPQAAKSLMAQLLNDDATLQKIKAFNAAQEPKSADPVVAARMKYGALLSRQNDLIRLAKDAGAGYAGISTTSDAAGNYQALYAYNSSLSSSANASMQQASNAAGSLLLAAAAKHDENLANKRLSFVKEEIREFDKTLRAFIEEVATLPEGNDKTALTAQISAGDTKLAEVLAEAAEAQQDAAKHVAAAGSNMAGNLQGFSTSFQAALSQSSASGQAITSGGSSAAADPAEQKKCADEATAMWKRSSEYQTWMRTKLNADEKYTEAKLIDLTIEHCGALLPPDEVAKLRQVSAQTKRDAGDIASGGKIKN